MCAWKFHIIFVKEKYKMAAICFFNMLFCGFYLTLHQNNGHEAKLELFYKKKIYYMNNNKTCQDTKWPPSV